ncbi:TPA: hypothetical protein ENS27_06590 [bacterium]|nr:hypothetical protein [bacterium]
MGNMKYILSWIVLISLGVYGCATTPDGKTTWNSPEACIAAHTAGGALVGALLGAAIGGIADGKKGTKKGAVGGGLGGGLLGFAYAWGKCFAASSSVQSQQVKDYTETASITDYTPEQGVSLKINDYSLNPCTVAPGDTVKFNANYYVMTPSPQDIPVTETRILKVYDTKQNMFVEQGSVPECITVSPGTRRADGQVQIPSNAVPGKYLIAFMVASEGKTDVAEMPLTITAPRQASLKN